MEDRGWSIRRGKIGDMEMQSFFMPAWMAGTKV
jgi:hypothetical protein